MLFLSYLFIDRHTIVSLKDSPGLSKLRCINQLLFESLEFKDFPLWLISDVNFNVPAKFWEQLSTNPRNQRLCPSCATLGDEHHDIYDCPDINRSPEISALHELILYEKLEFLPYNLDTYL